MKHLSNASAADQRGVTLVELLVAMAIGLVVVLVVSAAYLSGLNTQRSQSDMTRLQESARFAFDLLSKEMRKAGYRNTYGIYPASYNLGATRAQEFCVSQPAGSPIVGTNDATTVTVAGGGTATVLNSSDIITARYYGEDNAAGTAADGSVLDCGGNAVRRGTLVTDTLYVALDPSNNSEPTLFCSTTNPAGPANLPLIAGVESMQILYGEDTDIVGGTTSGTINRYVPAHLLASTDNISSILVSLVIRTPNFVASDVRTAAFNHFGSSYDPAANTDPGSVFPPPADRRLRLQFPTVIAVRNFSLCPS